MDMPLIIDGVAILILVIMAASAAKKGFVNCVFGLLTVIAALAVAFLFVNVTVEATGGFFGLQESTTRGVTNALSEMEIFALEFSESGIREQLSGQLPDFLIDIVIDNFKGQTLPEGMTIAMAVGETIGKLAATLVAWLSLFIITRILLSFLRKVIKSIVDKISLIKAIDGLLGFVVGALEGVLVLSALLAMVSMIPQANVVSMFQETVIVNYLYNQNPLTSILGQFI